MAARRPCRGERGVARRDLQRIHPDDPVGDAVEPNHLLGEHGRVAAVPSVGEDDDDRAPRHAALTPGVVELAEPLAETGTTAPVDDPRRRLTEGDVRVAARKLAGDAREPGTERERLDLLAPGHGGVDEPQQRPRVRLHRSADVEQQHQPPVARARFAPVTAERLATRLHRRPHRAPQVGAGGTSAAGGETARLAGRADEAQAGHQLLGLVQLLVRVVGEVLVPQHLGGAEPQLDRLLVGSLGGVGFVVGVVGGVVVDGERDVHRFLGRHVLAHRLAALPEHLERPVVGLVVLRAAHERGPTGPVRVVAIVDPGGDERFGERDRRAHRNGQAGAAQEPRERHGDLAGVGGRVDVVLGGPGHVQPGRRPRSNACFTMSATPCCSTR